jgi:hypothetical protein
MRRRRSGRLAAMWCIGLAIVACGPALATPTAMPPSPPVTQAAPAALAATGTATGAIASPTVSGDRLYLLDADARGNHILVLDAITGAVERTLPTGVPTIVWRTLYAAEQADGRTTIRAIEVGTGATLREMTLEGRFTLPYVGTGLTRIGLSRDSQTLVLAYLPWEEESARFTREQRSPWHHPATCST